MWKFAEAHAIIAKSAGVAAAAAMLAFAPTAKADVIFGVFSRRRKRM